MEKEKLAPAVCPPPDEEPPSNTSNWLRMHIEIRVDCWQQAKLTLEFSIRKEVPSGLDIQRTRSIFPRRLRLKCFEVVFIPRERQRVRVKIIPDQRINVLYSTGNRAVLLRIDWSHLAPVLKHTVTDWRGTTVQHVSLSGQLTCQRTGLPRSQPDLLIQPVLLRPCRQSARYMQQPDQLLLHPQRPSCVCVVSIVNNLYDSLNLTVWLTECGLKHVPFEHWPPAWQHYPSYPPQQQQRRPQWQQRPLPCWM